jgi:deoxyribodipyrimidine photo-lyase
LFLDSALLHSPYRRAAEKRPAFLPGGPGRTGYPAVDAAMRQLAATGWMHNRVRC